ncbi:MAG: hypothetical protein J6A43_00890 [Clostridia bacterium]|nr:hypothetical protein [Clostridia bacterium]
MSESYRNRYGKFPFFTPINIALIIAYIFLICVIYKTYTFCSIQSLCYSLFIFVLCVGGFISIYHPFTEKYYIHNNTIHHKKGKYKEDIPIPDYAIFVFSHTVLNFRYYGKYTVNIVTEDVDTTLKILHKNDDYNKSEMMLQSFKLYNIAGYSNRMVKGFLNHRCIYSFLYEKQFADEFFSSQKKTVIIPRSIYDKIEIAPDTYTIIIDEKA